MVNYKYGDLFKKDTVDKQLSIVSDDGKINITNTELHQEKFELTESLCSESELTFGACEAGMIKFTVSNVFLPMKGKWLTAKMTLDGHEDKPFQIGRYKVYSDTPTADRTCRDVVAYDALYDILSSDVTDWYNQILPQKDSKVTLKQFRDSFFNHFGVEQEEVSLVNDEMIIEKTVEVKASSSGSSDTAEKSTIGEAISGKEVLFCILEINGCMGNIGRVGKFRYVYLTQEMQGLYPANDLYPADDLYPRNPKSTSISKSQYISAQYEDYIVRTIDKLQIREKENDIGAIVGDGGNTYVIEGNFLVYGKGTKELNEIGEKTLSKIKGIIYRPFSADCKGNPCLEAGDAVRLATKYELIETYILKRTLKGIQALRDDLEANGEEYRTSKVNGIQRSILQLKGKSNTLERSIEETKSTIVDVEKGLQSQITQTATEIRSEVKNTTDGLSSRITQTAESITAEVNRATSAEGTLSSKITQTAESITAEVNRATEKEGQLAAAIQVNADGITSKVSRDSVVSEINQSAEGLKIRADLLEFRGSMEMTGGYVHIDAAESTDNLVELKREGTLVQMGTDGFRTVEGTLESPVHQCTVQYNQVSLHKGANDNDHMMIHLDGDTGVGGFRGGVINGSDKRIKNTILDLSKKQSSEFIYSLRAKSYRYNFEKDGFHHGFIAQDVLKKAEKGWNICPKTFSDSNGKKYYGLKYTELIADLVATVQLQHDEIEQLKEKVENL